MQFDEHLCDFSTVLTDTAHRAVPRRLKTGPILSVFPALIVHSELKSVHPGFPVAFIFKHKLINKLCCFQLVCSNLLLLWIELVHYITHELLKLCTPKNSLGPG